MLVVQLVIDKHNFDSFTHIIQ